MSTAGLGWPARISLFFGPARHTHTHTTKKSLPPTHTHTLLYSSIIYIHTQHADGVCVYTLVYIRESGRLVLSDVVDVVAGEFKFRTFFFVWSFSLSHLPFCYTSSISIFSLPFFNSFVQSRPFCRAGARGTADENKGDNDATALGGHHLQSPGPSLILYFDFLFPFPFFACCWVDPPVSFR